MYEQNIKNNDDSLISKEKIIQEYIIKNDLFSDKEIEINNQLKIEQSKNFEYEERIKNLDQQILNVNDKQQFN